MSNEREMEDELICKKCGNEIDDIRDVCEQCLKKLAEETSKYFEYKKRHDTDDSITCCKSETPAWVREMVYEAHDGLLPDDYKYEYIRDAVEAIADSGLDEPEFQTDAYTYDLINWMNSHHYRRGYCDDAIKDGMADSIDSSCAYGQYQERQEVYNVVLDCLINKLHQLDLVENNSNI